MRVLALTAACLLAAPALAQSPVPDTTDWHRYLPLAVGNEWQYEFRLYVFPGYDRRVRVVGDSLVEGEAYFAVEECTRFGLQTEVECDPLRLVRYDEGAAAVVERVVSGGTPSFVGWPRGQSLYADYCQLDLPFGPIPFTTECVDDENPVIYVYGEYGTRVDIGTDASPEGTLKAFGSGFNTVSFFAGIGFFDGSYESDGSLDLVFARVDDVEYGEPVITVAAEEGPSRGAPAFSFHPNPLREAATLSFTLAAPEALTLEVFDVQGRRVRSAALGAFGTGAHAVPFEREDLPAGAYQLRLVGDGGFSATRGVIVHR